MLCSVLISNYNKEKYIENCLNSLSNQTYKNFEIILSDNMSTDNSVDIASKFRKVKIIKVQKISTNPAINQINCLLEAFKISKGGLIFLLDSDDFFSNKKLEYIVKEFKMNKFELICDIPKLYVNKFINKDLAIKNYPKFLKNWNTIIPTSGISCTKSFFENFKKHILQNSFESVEIDFRINIFGNMRNELKFFKKHSLTFYNQVNDGIMSNYTKFDKNWWKKRYLAHQYCSCLHKRNNLKFNKSLDYFFTNTVYHLLIK